MKTFEISRAADQALTLNEAMKREFGAGLLLEATAQGGGSEALTGVVGAITRKNEFDTNQGEPEYVVIPAGRNIGVLKPGTGFGLLTPQGVAPAIISPRSRSGELHVLYLSGETIRPQDIGRLGYEPTQVQRSILQGVNPFQERRVGDHAADNSASVASEGGHSMLGLKGLTDRSVKESIFAGQHVVHDIAKSQKGIMPAFAQAGSNGYGMFSMEGREVVPDEQIITPHDKAFLIDHPHYRSISLPVEGLEASPELIVMGIGMIAAKDQLSQDDDQLRDSLLTIMDKL